MITSKAAVFTKFCKQVLSLAENRWWLVKGIDSESVFDFMDKQIAHEPNCLSMKLLQIYNLHSKLMAHASGKMKS